MTIDSFFSLEYFAHKDLWVETEPVWHPLLHLEDYVQTRPLGIIESEISEHVFLKDKDLVSIEKGTIIEPGVMIQGPCIIGKNCVIRHSAYLRGPLILGDGCHIGHSAELKHSILLDGAHATHFVYVGDSILGNSVNLGAGVKCANLRLDRSEVTVCLDGKKIKSGLRKFGAIIGDRSQIGCNCVLNPGTLFSRESISFPLMNLSGYIPPRSQVHKKGIKPIEKKILGKLLWQPTSIASV
jgi:NDP-sugar pyrophosphorylase family protein